jgi:hypothetical protein
MFILFDGKKTVADILASTGGMGATAADVESLMQAGFLARAADDVPVVPVATPAASAVQAVAEESGDAPMGTVVSDRTEQQRYQDAKPIATQLTAKLGLRGFMLNLSVESAAGYPELLALLPKIQEALGTKACRELERALKG